jgi:hypothetical protein
MGRVISWAFGGLVMLLVVIAAAGAGGMSALFGGGAAYACTATVTTPGTLPAGLSAEQAGSAAVIIGIGQRIPRLRAHCASTENRRRGEDQQTVFLG